MKNIFHRNHLLTCKLDSILIVYDFHYFVNFSDVGDSPTEPGTEDIDSEVYPSEDGKFFFIRFWKSFFYLVFLFQNLIHWKLLFSLILMQDLVGNFH